MIYGRFGGEVKIVRMGTLDDVKNLDKRKPDKQDADAVENGSYVVVEFADDKKQQLYHLAYLRADGAFTEIMAAVRAVGGDKEHGFEHDRSCYEEQVGNQDRDTFWVCGPGCPTLLAKRIAIGEVKP